MSGCDLFYFIPPKKSIIDFQIGDYSGKWDSSGFEESGDYRVIQFASSSPNTRIPGLGADVLYISFKDPVKVGVLNKKNSDIDFDNSKDIKNDFLIDLKNPRTKIRIYLTEWSDKPRGLIEGNIKATLIDLKGKSYQMTGHFRAYQALGTINSFH